MQPGIDILAAQLRLMKSLHNVFLVRWKQFSHNKGQPFYVQQTLWGEHSLRQTRRKIKQHKCLFSIPQINHFFNVFLSCMRNLKHLMRAFVCLFGMSCISFAAECLPCRSLTGSEGVSLEEICGVIRQVLSGLNVTQKLPEE